MSQTKHTIRERRRWTRQETERDRCHYGKVLQIVG
jgi:hypothetical protein